MCLLRCHNSLLKVNSTKKKIPIKRNPEKSVLRNQEKKKKRFSLLE